MERETSNLYVVHTDSLVGTIVESGPGSFTFAYSRDWLLSEKAFAISLSLPLREGAHSSSVSQRFFANLLPEGRIRYLVCRRLGISQDNDFQLLKAIGGECAGALMILPDIPSEHSLQESKYRPLSAAEIANLVTQGSALPALLEAGTVRLSLAGAQDKVPVLYQEGKLFLPLGSSPSSHILKLPNRDFKHLPQNEHIATTIAGKIGLPVVETELLTEYSGCCLVSRYDRVIDSNGSLRRMHQEDFCQAMGLSSFTKYEQEGGPAFRQCVSLAGKHSVDPFTDTESLIKWLVFNVLVGNADSHAKNLSILYTQHGLRLAPFYDLVSTACYPSLDTRMAMAIGGIFAPGQTNEKAWRLLAEQLDIGYRLIESTARSMAESILAACSETLEQFRLSYGPSPISEMIKRVVHERSRRMLWQLDH